MLNYMKEIIEFWADKADCPAVIDNDEFLTGRQCAAIAQATIDMMAANDVLPGEVVAFTGSDTLPKIPILVGMFFSGRISSALAPFASAPSRQRMLEESGAKLVIVDHKTRHMAESSMSETYQVPIVEEESFVNLTAELDPMTLMTHVEKIDNQDWAVLRYTSGSTGQPKGMLLRQQETELMSFNFVNRTGGTKQDGRFLCTMPLSSLEGCGMAQMFMVGGLVPCIYRGRATPAGILAEMERLKITTLFLPSSQLTAMVRDPSFEMTDLSHLKAIAYAGQTILPQDLQDAIRLIGGEKLVQCYGQTEAGMLSALDQADHCSGDPEILASAGRLFFPDDIEIRDEQGDVVPEGTSGELYVKGDYINAARWTKDRTWESIVDADGWMATSDMVRRIGDRIWVTGRKRDMVLYRGYNVPTRPIEECLSSFPGVTDAVVHPVDDSYAGEVVFAWLRLEPGASIDKEAACDYVQERVSKWSRPSYIDFVTELPQISALKKTDKVLLTQWGQERVAAGQVERLKGADGVL